MDEDEGQVGYEASEAGYERTAIIDDGLLSFICKAFALCFDSYFKIIFFFKSCAGLREGCIWKSRLCIENAETV